MREIQLPDIGDFKDVDVSEILVAPGDAVTAEQSLITVESDKASMEIPSPAAGVVREIRVKLGDKVKKGSLILVMDESPATAVPAAAVAATKAAPPAPLPRTHAAST